jgi:hypothetical protein
LGGSNDSSLGTAQGSGTGGASLGETMSTEIASVASESNGFAPVNSTASTSAPP